MKRMISMIARGADGKLKVVHDRESVECDDAGAGVDQLVTEQQAKGASDVLVLLADGSVFRHWTRPSDAAEPAPAAGGGKPRAAKARRKKR